MNLPSKATLKRAAEVLRVRAVGEGEAGYADWAAELRGVADFLDNHVDQQPKAESLREAVRRLYARPGSLIVQARADALDLVLGRLDRLEEIMIHYLTTSAPHGMRKALQQERAEIAQMREGCDVVNNA